MQILIQQASERAKSLHFQQAPKLLRKLFQRSYLVQQRASTKDQHLSSQQQGAGPLCLSLVNINCCQRRVQHHYMFKFHQVISYHVLIVNILSILDYMLLKPLLYQCPIQTTNNLCFFGCWNLIITLQMVLCRENSEKCHYLYLILTATGCTRTLFFSFLSLDFFFLTTTESMDLSQIPGNNPDLHIFLAYYN